MLLAAAAIILAPAAAGICVAFWLLVRRLRNRPVLFVPTHFEEWPALPAGPEPPKQLMPGPPPPFLLPPVSAIVPAETQVERGDLVDMEGSPHVGVVQCVDDNTAWCRLVKSGTRHPNGLTTYEFKGTAVWPWPVSNCSIMDRGLTVFSGSGEN